MGRAIRLLVVLGLLIPSALTRISLGNGCEEKVLRPREGRETALEVTVRELEELVSGNTAFALELYRELPREGNLFTSPYSISLALAMAYAGARGETARQMAEALHFTLPPERLHLAFDALDLVIASRAAEGIALRVANALWGQLGHPFLDEYIDLLARYYGVEIHLLGFQEAPEACRARINEWVSEKTEGRIRELLPPGSVDTDTRLVLTNAIYFKGIWEWKFDPGRTHMGPFTLLDGTRIQVPMMEQEAGFAYTEGSLSGVRYQAVELPYAGEKLSMVILLPELEDFREFEEGLDRTKLEEILGGLLPQEVRLLMPKFSFSYGFSLKEALSALGMPLAFSEEADFSGMDGKRDLWIDDIYHKAFVEVNEEGTEAAAATGLVVGLLAAPPPYELRIDHPFIFLIRDRETGAILFLGRALNPVA